MKPKNAQKLIKPQDSINKLILHFNVDKTIIMRDSLSYDNSDVIVSISFNIKFKNIFIYLDQRNLIRINLGKRRQK